jgi:hypothetical protein
MRKVSAFLAALAILAAPAAAQTSTPRQMMRALGAVPSDREVQRAVERAAGQPLGSRLNPVRVSAPSGEHEYIARLRCGDGTAPRVGQRSNAGEGPFGTIIDVYPLDCGEATPRRFELAMDMYHDDHVETRAPEGFTLAPK